MDDEFDILSSLDPVPDVGGNPGPPRSAEDEVAPASAALSRSMSSDGAAADPIELAPITAKQPTGRLRVVAVAALIAVIAGLGGLAFVSNNSDADDQNLSLEEDESDNDDEAPEDDVDISRPPAAAIVAATPTDGQDSLRHPLLAEPREGLADGQRIAISGAEFPANEQVGVVQCVFTGQNGSVDDCDIGAVEIVSVQPDGTFAAQFTVRRNFPTADGVVDCASPPDDKTCMIAAGALSNYDESGAASIFFATSGEATETPIINVDRTEQLLHDDPLVVTGSGFDAGEEVNLHQCSIGGFSGIQQCSAGNAAYQAVADDNGDIAVTVPALRSVIRHDGISDCATNEFGCFLIASRVPSPNITRLSFDADGPPGPQPEITIEPSTGLVEGQTVTVNVSGLPFDGPADINQCVAANGLPRCNPSDTIVNVVEGSLSAEVVVTRGIILSGLNPVDCVADECLLRVSVAGAQLANGAISFDPDGPEPDLPRLVIEPNEGLKHLEEVELSMTGGVSGFAQICAQDPALELAEGGYYVSPCRQLGQIGSTPNSVAVSRMLWGVESSDDIDCAVEACVVRVFGGTSQFEAPISFDPSGQLPARPVLKLSAYGPYQDGDVVSVELEGLPSIAENETDTFFWATICSAARTHCRQSPNNVSPTGSISLTARRMLPSQNGDSGWIDCAVEECRVQFETPFGGFSAPIAFDASQPVPDVPKFTVEQVDAEIVISGTNVDLLGPILSINVCDQTSNNSTCESVEQLSDSEWRVSFPTKEAATKCLSACWISVYGDDLQLQLSFPDFN